MREEKLMQSIRNATLMTIAICTAIYFGIYGIYVAFSNPELTQTQVLFKLLGVE